MESDLDLDPRITVNMLLEILACVSAPALADALGAAGYDQDVIVPLLRQAGADLSVYEPNP